MININKQNLAILIITYNPSNNLELLVNKCSKLSNYIYVIDNGSSDVSNLQFLSNIANDIVKLIRLKENKGIGTAVNMTISLIDTNIVKWLLTFDQDSLPPDNLLNNYDRILSEENQVALIGINYLHDNANNNCHFSYTNSLDLITSGTLHNLRILDIIGKYNEKLFIDCVDFEINLRANLAGYKTIMLTTSHLEHTIGNPKSIRICGFTLESMNHNAFRQYYIVRNHIWLLKKYIFRSPLYIINKFYHLMIRLIKTMIIDDDKSSKLKSISKGLIDGIKYSM